MSDWSYRKGMPRSQAHYEQYGNYNVPPRRGVGGASLTEPSDSWVWILGLGLLLLAMMRKS